MSEANLEIGESMVFGEARSVEVTREDSRRHFYVLGQSGTGKSTLLRNLIRQRIEAGDGVAVMWDPLESTCRHASLSIL